MWLAPLTRVAVYSSNTCDSVRLESLSSLFSVLSFSHPLYSVSLIKEEDLQTCLGTRMFTLFYDVSYGMEIVLAFSTYSQVNAVSDMCAHPHSADAFLLDIQVLMGSLVYLRQGIENSPYVHLLDANQWADICDIFTRDACALLGLSVESPLSVRCSNGPWLLWNGFLY